MECSTMEGGILFYSSWIGTPRGAALPQETKGLGPGKQRQMANQQTRVGKDAELG